MIQRPYIVSIVERYPGYVPDTFVEREVLGFACATEEEARERAAAAVQRLSTVLFHVAPGERKPREHKAIFRKACEVCSVTGIKPGCKRKKCEACGGWGSTGDVNPPPSPW